MVLIQRLHFGDDGAFRPRFSNRLPPRDITKTFELDSATWWRPNDVDASTVHTVAFSGELLLKDDLVPGCEILNYSHEVCGPLSSSIHTYSKLEFFNFLVRIGPEAA